jgi:solute carrier family 9 (sodium/hydrogen exchanger), member 3
MANRIRLIKLSVTDQFVMSFGGLRGAIAFALAALLEKEVYKSRELMITATIVVVYFTNLILV